MKVRNGFVSNSSSSSFILAFDKDVITEEKMYELFKQSLVDNSRRLFKELFLDNEAQSLKDYCEDEDFYDDSYIFEEISEVFETEEEQNKLSVLDICLDSCDNSGEIEIMNDFVNYVNKIKVDGLVAISNY